MSDLENRDAEPKQQTTSNCRGFHPEILCELQPGDNGLDKGEEGLDFSGGAARRPDTGARSSTSMMRSKGLLNWTWSMAFSIQLTDIHWPEPSGGPFTVVTDVAASEAACCVRADGCWLAARTCAPMIRLITIIQMTREPLVSPRLSSMIVALRGTVELEFGRRRIRRLAAAPASKRPAVPGSPAINEASRFAAASTGNFASSAASFHGSRSRRASAERTLSIIPFPSSPTEA